MAEIIVKIDPKTGERILTVQGISGASCEDIAQAIARTSEVISQGYTAEYYIPDELPIFEEN